MVRVHNRLTRKELQKKRWLEGKDMSHSSSTKSTGNLTSLIRRVFIKEVRLGLGELLRFD